MKLNFYITVFIISLLVANSLYEKTLINISRILRILLLMIVSKYLSNKSY